MWFLRMIWANVWGRPIRSGLTVAGVAVAICAVISLVSIARGFTTSLLRVYQQRGITLLVTQAGRVQQISSVLPESLGTGLQQVPGVARVAACLTEVVALDNSSMVGVPVQGWTQDSFMLDELDIVAGSGFSGDVAREMLVGEALARALDKKAGDVLELLPGEPFRIAGVYHTTNVLENGAIVVPLHELQKLMLREGEVTAFAVVTKGGDRATIGRVKRAIQREFPEVAVDRTQDYIENTAEMRVARSIAWMTSTIAVFVGSIAMLNTMLMAVFERYQEMAVLRAIGWRKWRIVALILWEALFLGTAGATIGTVAALVLTHLLTHVPGVDRYVAADVSVAIIVQGFLIALALAMVGSVYPAYRATRVSPMQGLRHP